MFASEVSRKLGGGDQNFFFSAGVTTGDGQTCDGLQLDKDEFPTLAQTSSEVGGPA